MDNATNEILQLDSLIKESNSILVVGHVGPDPDALGSLVATKTILENHYKKTNIVAAAERIPSALSFIPGYAKVLNTEILPTLQKNSFDLVICLDFNQWHMLSKFNAKDVQEHIQKAGIPLVVIDHHPQDMKNIEADVYIRIDPMSTASNLYQIFFGQLGAELSPDIADDLLIGIVSDTGNFKYSYGAPSQAPIMTIGSKLLEKSTMNLERISDMMDRNDVATLKIVGLLLERITLLDEHTAYTYFNVEDISKYDLDQTRIGDATGYVTNKIISLVGTAERGFLVYPHLASEKTYTVRLRSSDAQYPVNEIAAKLGGGGHAQSAASRVSAANCDEVIEKVKNLLKE